MRLTQDQLETLQDLLSRGEITAAQANVEKVKMTKVQLITRSLPAQVRKALNAAVRSGELGHWKESGRKPEVYFHPAFDQLATQARNKYEQDTLKALAAVIAQPERSAERSA